MRYFVWAAQIILALLAVSGGAYKVFKYEAIASQMQPLGRGPTVLVGVIEMVCGVLLVVPGALSLAPELTAMGAALLAVESLALSGLYGRRSMKIAATNPLVFSLGTAVLAAFVAYMWWPARPVV